MPKWNVAVHYSRIQTNTLVVLFLVMHPQNIGMNSMVDECSRGFDFCQYEAC